MLAASESLEATVLQERANELRKLALKLARQRAFLREERQKARRDAERAAALAFRRRGDWWPAAAAAAALPPPAAPRARLNVGGQIFEVTHEVLQRDKDSLLAKLSETEVGEGEAIFVDRDWWIFRYLLIFFRDGRLPDDAETLSQLYREARFWKSSSLAQAIEETHLNLKRGVQDGDDDNEKWWETLPNWWASAPPKEEEKEEEEEDWWKGKTYKGRAFGDLLSTAPDKVHAEDEKDDDAVPMLQSTWSARYK